MELTVENIRRFLDLIDRGAHPRDYAVLGITPDQLNNYAQQVGTYRAILANGRLPEQPKAIKPPESIKPKKEPRKVDKSRIDKEDYQFACNILELLNTNGSMKSFKAIGVNTQDEVKFHATRRDFYRSIIRIYEGEEYIIEEEPQEVINERRAEVFNTPAPSYPLDNTKSVLIALPCYNHASLVGDAIKSLLKQSYKNFAIVACDDASTDVSYEILSEYLSYPNFHLMRNTHNLGTGRTLNRIIWKAIGLGAHKTKFHGSYDYITWVSADNIYYSDFLESHVNMLKCGNAVSMSAYDVFGDLTVTNRYRNFSLKQLAENGFGPSFMFTRKLWLMCGPYHDMPGEDWVFYAKAAAINAKFGIIDNPLMGYRKHGNSVTGKLGRGEIASPDAQEIARLFITEHNGTKAYD